MTERVQAFGEEHTRRKLDVVAKYLAAYVTVMKKQDFRLFYVDGFAGSGGSGPKVETQTSIDPTLFPSDDFLEGSPIRALTIDPPFVTFSSIRRVRMSDRFPISVRNSRAEALRSSTAMRTTD